jgi:hypothetical protein
MARKDLLGAYRDRSWIDNRKAVKSNGFESGHWPSVGTSAGDWPQARRHGSGTRDQFATMKAEVRSHWLISWIKPPE